MPFPPVKINGLTLDPKQAGFYQALSKKSPSAAKKFLSDLATRKAKSKEVLEDVITLCRREGTDLADLKTLDNRGVHNFSLGALETYHYVTKYADEGRVILFRGRILISPSMRGGYRVWVFDYKPEDIPVLQKLQCISTIFSLEKIKELSHPMPFKEFSYSLEKVFDPSSYSSYKRRKEILGRPLRKIQAEGVTATPMTEADLSDCKELHDAWVDKKLSDERTFQILFPRKRYFYCMEMATRKENRFGIDYRATVFRQNDRVVAIDVDTVENGRAFGLACFGRFWENQNHFMRGIDVWVLTKLRESGVDYYNSGATTGANLTQYKSAYPHDLVISWTYQKVKE